MLDPLQTSLNISASGLAAQSTRLRVVTENLANSQSTGRTPGADPYTRKMVSFESIIDEASGANLVKVGQVELARTPYRIEKNPDHPARTLPPPTPTAMSSSPTSTCSSRWRTCARPTAPTPPICRC